jgi:hypothetical protein
MKLSNKPSIAGAVAREIESLSMSRSNITPEGTAYKLAWIGRGASNVRMMQSVCNDEANMRAGEMWVSLGRWAGRRPVRL